MYTNAQVASLVTALDARIARVEAILVAGAPATAQASAPVVAAATALETPSPKQHAVCAKNGKTFTVTPAGAPSGTGFHDTWCKAGYVA